jgi:tetratricopeptide (TPR) repeat protein
VAEFNPRQLDQLEDALESLEEIDDLESLELSPELSERLGEYQDVLALCREAFPLEAPAEDLLDGVIAEAREASRRPRLRDGLDANASGWRRFWERWRGTVIPGIALAGTAAAVLWLLEPEAELANSTDLLTDEASQDDQRSDEPERSQPASEPKTSSAGEADELEGPSEPSEAGDDEPEPPESDDGGAEPKRKRSKRNAGASPSVEPPEPEPAPEPMTKDETWKALERANAARRTGNCDRARSLYEEVIAASTDSLAIARARAGIGLCFEQDRRDSEAASWFEQAREASPGIDAWINTQRDEQPLPGEKKHKRKKKKTAAPPIMDQANEAL